VITLELYNRGLSTSLRVYIRAGAALRASAAAGNSFTTTMCSRSRRPSVRGSSRTRLGGKEITSVRGFALLPQMMFPLFYSFSFFLFSFSP
jgi:hypothetical protein